MSEYLELWKVTMICIACLSLVAWGIFVIVNKWFMIYYCMNCKQELDELDKKLNGIKHEEN